jgi:hypothetical protein
MNFTLLSEVYFAAFLRLYSHLYILFHILRCSDFCLGRLFSDGTLLNVLINKGGYTLLYFFDRFLFECCSPLCFRCGLEWCLNLLFLFDYTLLSLFGRADSTLRVAVHCTLFLLLRECILLGSVFGSNFYESILELFIRHRVLVVREVYYLLLSFLSLTAFILFPQRLYSRFELFC